MKTYTHIFNSTNSFGGKTASNGVERNGGIFSSILFSTEGTTTSMYYSSQITIHHREAELK